MAKKSTLNVKDVPVVIIEHQEQDFISMTDMVKNFEGGSALIEQWLRTKDTILFLGVWERLYNPNFNSLEFEGISNEAGRNSFYLSTKKWIEKTDAKGIVAKAGRYGGTYAHKDIAFEFATWLSPEFKLFLIREFERLKAEEIQKQSLEWDLHRTLSKVNYKLHTQAIKETLPPDLSKQQKQWVYANEADLLNLALYGITAKQWREENLDLQGNIRDYSSVTQLLVLANLETLNAEYIRMGLESEERLLKLNQSAIQQMSLLLQDNRIKKLEKK